jgi:tetratricopeptide (TPR) repeat protein
VTGRAVGDDSSATTTYTLRRVQAMLGLSRSVVAGLIAEGFVSPARGKRGEWRFGFQDLMLLRTAFALQQSKIPPRRILRSLARLKAELPAELPLTGLRISAIGADVAVRSPQGQWQAASGQLLMDFDVVAAPVAGSVAFLERGDDAQAWFDRGVAAERGAPAVAETAYLKALALAPGFEAAALNLGAMWADAGRHAELLALCDRALAHAPASALLHFNRAVALDHLERAPAAMASYEHSLVLDPTLADAHYNLGRLREQLGDARGALRHFSAYRRLQRG